MRLKSVLVESFGCIGRAELELGAGLNVLYGPNDLGKSTLVDAIRCGFLMMYNSAGEETRALRPWKNGSAPIVTLVYETEDQRIWRVRKRFDGNRGEATLERSRDGRDFQDECNGRAVEQAIREQLAWGIPAPGPGGGRGLPRTFLATALLARQGEVDEILASTLDADPEDSGQRKLSAALQAIAQDPMFKRILGEVQAKVDEAFTERGAWKRGKKDQVTQLIAAVDRAAKEEEALQARVLAGKTVKDQLRALGLARDAKVTAIEEASAALGKLRGLVELAALIESRRAEVARAAAAVRAADESAASVKALEGRHRELAEREAKAAARVIARLTEVQELEAGLAAARERLRAMESEGKRHQVAAARAAAENRRLAGEAIMRDATLELERARSVGQLEERVGRAAAELATVEGKLAVCRGRVEQAETERVDVAGILALRTFEDARVHLGRAEANVALRERLKGDLEATVEEETRLGAELAGRVLPTAERVAEVQRLSHEVAIKEGRLEVGLAVELRPARPLRATASQDGRAASPEEIAAARTFTAARELRLVIEGVGELVAMAGKEDARAEAAAARRRLDAALAPILEAARLPDLDSVGRSLATARAVEDLRGRGRDLQRQLDAIGDVDAALEEGRERLAAAGSALDGADRSRLERLSAQRAGERARDLNERLRAAERASEAAKKEAQRLEIDANEYRVLHRTAGEQLAAVAQVGPWREAVRAAQARLDEARLTVEQAAKELAGLEERTTAGRKQAVAAVAAAEEALARGTEARDAAVNERDTARQELAKLGGQLEERRRAAESFDRDALTAELRRAEEALRSIVVPDRLATQGDVDEVAARVQRLHAERDQIEDELHRTEGTLTGVEGAVAEDQLREASVALDRARQRQQEVQEEYSAYKLLCDTLQEAQREESVHLGQVLGEPLAAEFRALAGARYEGLSVSTGLRTEGVTVAGAPRELDRLSIGTREQLATLFRLALARQVGSLVILDDQLVQSDPPRMAFFARLLREVAQSVQVLVFTCRPGDYVGPDLMPPGGGPPALDHGGLGLRVIDLGRGLVQGG